MKYLCFVPNDYQGLMLILFYILEEATVRLHRTWKGVVISFPICLVYICYHMLYSSGRHHIDATIGREIMFAFSRSIVLASFVEIDVSSLLLDDVIFLQVS